MSVVHSLVLRENAEKLNRSHYGLASDASQKNNNTASPLLKSAGLRKSHHNKMKVIQKISHFQI